MVQIEIGYRGQLRCSAKHVPSGTELTTDAPLDNKGRGESFSPTDLLATALGTCMLTIMGIRAEERACPLGGARVVVQKHMTMTGPRRVAKLDVSITVPEGRAIAAADREILERAAHSCPVRLSIAEAIEVPVTFAWGE